MVWSAVDAVNVECTALHQAFRHYSRIRQAAAEALHVRICTMTAGCGIESRLSKFISGTTDRCSAAACLMRWQAQKEPYHAAEGIVAPSQVRPHRVRQAVLGACGILRPAQLHMSW